MARATGVSRRAIGVGLAELQKPDKAMHPESAIRKLGGGRMKTPTKDPALLRDLKKLVEAVTRGDPESPLRWTCKSVRRLAEELRRGRPASHTLVAELLHAEVQPQANRKSASMSIPNGGSCPGFRTALPAAVTEP